MAASKDGRACSAQHHPPAQPLLKEKEEAARCLTVTHQGNPVLLPFTSLTSADGSCWERCHSLQEGLLQLDADTGPSGFQQPLGLNRPLGLKSPWGSTGLWPHWAIIGLLDEPSGKGRVWHSLWWKLLFLEDQSLCPCSLLGQQCMQGWGGKCCTVVDTKGLQLPAFSPIWPAAIRHGHDSLASLDFENLRSSALTLFFPVVAAFRNSILDSVPPQNKGRNFITDQGPQVNHPGAARTVFPEMSTILAQSWDTSHLLEPQPFCVGIWGCRGSSGTHGAQLVQAHGMDLGLASHIPNKSVQDTYTQPRRMNTHSPWRLS